MKKSEYKVLEAMNRLLESENEQLKLDLKNKDELLNTSHRKSATNNFNSLILENIIGGIYLIETKTGNILYANPTFEKMFGYETSELVGKNVSIVNAETDKSAQEIAQEIIQKLEQFGHWEGEVKNIKKDGTVFYCEAGVTTFEHSQYGSVWVSTHEDITEKKKIKQALKENTKKHKYITDNISDIVWTYDLNLKCTYISPSVFRIRGYTVEEAMTLTLEDTFSTDSVEMLQNLLKKKLQQIDVGNNDGWKPFVKDLELYKKDKSLIWSQISASLLKGEDGKPKCIMGVTRDISKQKKTELALKESDSRFRLIANYSNNWEVFRDKDAGLIYSSPSFEDLTGHKNEDYLSGKLTFHDIIHKDDIGLLTEKMRPALEGKKVNEFESRIITKDGLFKHVSIVAQPVKTDDGEQIGIRVSVRDISKRKQAEQALKESESNLKSLINNRNESIWSIDNNYNHIIFNNFFKESYFATFNIELQIGHNSLNLLPPDLFEFWKSKYDKALSGERVVFEFLNLVGNEPHHYEVSLNPIIVDGKVTGVSGLSIDITDRKLAEEALKESEQKFRSMFNEAPLGIAIIHSFTGKIRNINQKYAEIVGRTIEEMLTLDWMSITHPDDIQPDLDNMKLLNKGKIKGFQMEKRYMLPNGEIIWINLAVTPLYVSDKLNPYHLCMVENITDRKKSEQALKESETQLKELNATKDIFFSIIAHDLRSPFNTILGYTELLIENLRDYEVAKSEKYLGIINSSTKNTLILLDNLLNWAKSQTGQLSFNPEKIMLSEVILEIVEFKKLHSKSKNISLQYSPSDEFEVYADKNMMSTVLRNLISNAIKFTNPDGKINVFAISKQNKVEITISDNGVGMNKEAINKLFKINTDFTTVGTAEEKGSGLGLVLCKEFVEKHGGIIWVESEEGKGSDFKFTLPLNKPE